MAIKLILVDDHQVLLDGLEQLLRLEADFKVVATCGTVAAAVRAIDTQRPDILILDLRLQNESGFSVLRQLGSRKTPAVVVLTASDNEEDLLEAVRLGARGVVLKAMAPRILERCIRTVHAGGEWLTVEGQDLSARLAQRHVAERKMAERLTSRELEVMRLLASQLENEEIARHLGVSPGTVKIHIHHVYSKLGVSGRQDLQKYLKRSGY
jgi:DNA-binding NarL/FixJ family response regulator